MSWLLLNGCIFVFYLPEQPPPMQPHLLDLTTTTSTRVIKDPSAPLKLMSTG